MDTLRESSMRHFTLYSKGHYEKSDLMSDMKTIAAHRAQTKPKHILESDIVFLLLGEVERLTGITEHFLQFVTRIREDFVVWPAILKSPGRRPLMKSSSRPAWASWPPPKSKTGRRSTST